MVGEGMVIGPRVLKSLNCIAKMQPRMMVATFNGNPSTTIISSYSPINASHESNLDAFYNVLFSLVRCISKNSDLIIGGDTNAQIDKNVKNKFTLHDSTNRNREHLTDFTLENWLTCLNTKFPRRKGKLWTYTYTTTTKAQIDYILMNKKWINSALNCVAYSSFEGVSFDHRFVTAKTRLNLCRNAARTTTTAQWPVPAQPEGYWRWICNKTKKQIWCTSGNFRNTYSKWRIWELR